MPQEITAPLSGKARILFIEKLYVPGRVICFIQIISPFEFSLKTIGKLPSVTPEAYIVPSGASVIFSMMLIPWAKFAFSVFAHAIHPFSLSLRIYPRCTRFK